VSTRRTHFRRGRWTINDHLKTKKNPLNSALSSKINCMITGQCSNLSDYNHTAFSKSAQANTQLYRLKHSLIERHSTDRRVLLGCSGHVNNAFQPEYAGDMLKQLRDSLYFAASSPPNAHGSVCASCSYL